MPFGDYNGDANPDLLVRDGNGYMKAHLGTATCARHRRQRRDVPLPQQRQQGLERACQGYAGWNIYNSVVAIGDLDEDGHNDLVARDAGGLLWRYSGLGNGSFAARVQAGSGWNIFKIII
ncbi:FG-GAP repeat domain-containing protein [Micromonospora sp. NPDC047620]|uniref:FG-GAP repeat domain-containing protein n=1 Tax=Micromonospora sp. NPDC047620 TaxID=3364251 RepID=UPI00371C8A91